MRIHSLIVTHIILTTITRMRPFYNRLPVGSRSRLRSYTCPRIAPANSSGFQHMSQSLLMHPVISASLSGVCIELEGIQTPRLIPLALKSPYPPQRKYRQQLCLLIIQMPHVSCSYGDRGNSSKVSRRTTEVTETNKL